MTDNAGKSALASRHARVAVACTLFVAAMVGMAYAAVPLYRIFCQVTGYGGTTQTAARGADAVLERTIKVRFDANVGRGLGWGFRPEQREIELRVGETGLAFFRAQNNAGRKITGTATFNVTPPEAGPYFNKIECFCFTEQTLEPGEKAQMPVTFFVDPAIDDNRDLDYVRTITLSYTLFPAGRSARAGGGGNNVN